MGAFNDFKMAFKSLRISDLDDSLGNIEIQYLQQISKEGTEKTEIDFLGHVGFFKYSIPFHHAGQLPLLKIRANCLS